ncbi:DUF2846 domain-containing protein [Pseudomonas aeruginosa]|nr:DUF2846 domain-containing protein [Pseudomonas aeruginosa]
MHKLICLGLALLALPVQAAWYLDYESSRLSFISTKNATLSEVGRFLVMHGKVDDKGQARLRVELDSVSTDIPLRDERIREHQFETGSYKLEMRRPLAGSFWTLFADGPMDFTRIASFMLEARAGSVYYLRYDELNPPPKSEHPAGEGDGPLQLVAADLGAAEIGATHQVQEPMQFAASGYRKRVQRSFWEGVGRALDKIGI